MKSALGIWEKLVLLTDGLYPEQMAFGPDDIGHWKDKLPYVRHDLELARERAEVFDRFGRFDFGFDFGGPVRTPASPAAYRANAFVLRNTVAPRFQAVDANTLYSDALGYGWTAQGERTSEAIPLTPYLEVRAVVKDPKNLPRDVLYRDFLRGKGAQVFRVKAGPGDYQVHFLHPDHREAVADVKADGGFLEIAFPAGEWSVSGLVIQGPGSRLPIAPQRFPKALPRPAIAHDPPATAAAGQPLRLAVRVSSPVGAIRLHYRPVNQTAKFQTIENAGGAFVIPGDRISAKWDLMYYFEILNQEGGGWFQPDPRVATPYYVVKVE